MNSNSRSYIGSHNHKRSRSPASRDHERDVKRHRSRSPHQRKDRTPKAKLPFGGSHLHKHDFEAYRSLFAEYLDLQKQLDIDQLDEHVVKGRWKSFLNKWNRGELAEGWYDSETKRKADSRATDTRDRNITKIAPMDSQISKQEPADVSDEDEDGYGPALPNAGTARKTGPAVPSFQDLQHRRELAEDDREARIADLRYERKQDRKTQKERLEEMAPRADPGSRERLLEKKRETTSTNRAFAEAKEAGAEEVGERDLLGDDEDGFRRRKKEMERQKNEREIRKEEVLRARAAEREERMQEHRRKEEKTMDMLKAIAQQRFGGGT